MSPNSKNKAKAKAKARAIVKHKGAEKPNAYVKLLDRDSANSPNGGFAGPVNVSDPHLKPPAPELSDEDYESEDWDADFHDRSTPTTPVTPMKMKEEVGGFTDSGSERSPRYGNMSRTPKMNKDGAPRKPRSPRSKLLRWTDNDWKQVVLSIVWACGEADVNIPFGQAANQVNASCTAGALQQALLKLRVKLIAEGFQIPPLKMAWTRNKAGASTNGNRPQQSRHTKIVTIPTSYTEETRTHLEYPYTYNSPGPLDNDDPMGALNVHNRRDVEQLMDAEQGDLHNSEQQAVDFPDLVDWANTATPIQHQGHHGLSNAPNLPQFDLTSNFFPVAQQPQHQLRSVQYGEQAFGEQAFGEQAFGEQAFGEHAFGEHAFGEHAFGEHAFGEHAFGEPAFGEPAFGMPQQDSFRATGTAYDQNFGVSFLQGHNSQVHHGGAPSDQLYDTSIGYNNHGYHNYGYSNHGYNNHGYDDDGYAGQTSETVDGQDVDGARALFFE